MAPPANNPYAEFQQPAQGNPYADFQQPVAETTAPAPEKKGFFESALDATGIPGIYHAITDPETDAEKATGLESYGNIVGRTGQRISNGVALPVISNAKAAFQDAKAGNGAGVLSHAVSALPVIGPIMDTAVDQYADKNYAGEAGTLAGFGASVVAPKAIGAALRPVARAAAIGDTTRMIRPNSNDVSFGKQPAVGLLEQPGGTLSMSKEALLDKSKAHLNTVGQQIHNTITNAPQNPMNISGAVTSPFVSALSDAAKMNNRGLFSRLQEVKEGLTNDLTYDPVTEQISQVPGPKNLTAVKPVDVFDLKKRVGDNTKWTNQAFDNEVNATQGQVYAGLKNALNTQVPELVPLNEKYGNLRAGINALDRRIPIEARNNAISLPDATLAAGGAATGGLPYAVAGLAAKKLINSAPVRTALQTGLYTFGKTQPHAMPNIPSLVVRTGARQSGRDQ